MTAALPRFSTPLHSDVCRKFEKGKNRAETAFISSKQVCKESTLEVQENYFDDMHSKSHHPLDNEQGRVAAVEPTPAPRIHPALTYPQHQGG